MEEEEFCTPLMLSSAEQIWPWANSSHRRRNLGVAALATKVTKTLGFQMLPIENGLCNGLVTVHSGTNTLRPTVHHGQLELQSRAASHHQKLSETSLALAARLDSLRLEEGGAPGSRVRCSEYS